MKWPQRKKIAIEQEDTMVGAQVAASLREGKAMQAIFEGVRGITEINRTAQANHHQAGFRAEQYHRATLNADAARKGLNVRAHLTTPGQAADIQLTAGNRVVGEVQVKNCKTVARTTSAVSRAKYDGMQKVVPADQAAQVRDLAARRGTDGLGQRNYADTSEAASARVKAGGAQSGELSYEQAQDAGLADRMVRGEMVTAVKSAALGGAVIGGVVSAVKHGQLVHQGEQTISEAAKAVAVDAAKAAAAGTVSGAVTAAATAAVEQLGKKALVGAPGAAIAAGIEISKDALAWRQGKLSAREVGSRSIEHLAGSGGVWGGAAAGMAICAPIPVVGSLVGGVIGGMLGSAAAKGALRQGKEFLK